MDIDIIKKMYKFSSNHRELILNSPFCGCFHCRNSCIMVRDIVEWVDNGKTAICPKCGVDAILPGILEVPVTEGFLDQMNRYFFQQRIKDSDSD